MIPSIQLSLQHSLHLTLNLTRESIVLSLSVKNSSYHIVLSLQQLLEFVLERLDPHLLGRLLTSTSIPAVMSIVEIVVGKMKDAKRRIDVSLRLYGRNEPMVCLTEEVPRNMPRVAIAVDEAVDVQTGEVGSIGQNGESRTVHGLLRSSITPLLQHKLSERGTVLEPDVRTESMQGRSVLQSEHVGTVKDGLGLSEELTIEQKDARSQRRLGDWPNRIAV